ncbi:organic cation transporter protein-like [Argiope bruennichi]|uniref:organic cation transporter protein-like n=1 Tax=Argiope bruennichi TaxID=94029 RepID=UPI00249483C6|nr:organic cation transporter protein-like [Argiope bruennichi]
MAVAKDYTDIIGGHGWFQFSILIFCFFCAAPHCMHDFSITFFAPNIDYWCARPEEVLESNISAEKWKNSSIPVTKNRNGLDEYNHCTFYNSSIVNGSLYHRNDSDAIRCNSWEYDHSSYKRTIIDEWDLVCDREWLVSMAKTVYMLGFLFGSVINGQLSDRFGRRKVLIFCLIDFLIFGFLTLLSPNIIMFLICRFGLAFGITSAFVNSPVILAEIVGFEYRSVYCFTYKYGFTLAFMTMPLIAWLIPDWFWLHLIFTLPFVALLCVFWVLPETPRWLLVNGKFQELEELLLYAAKKNGKDMKKATVEIRDFIDHHSQERLNEVEKEEKATVLDLVRPKLIKNTLIIFLCWFINSYIYYVLAWNTNDLGGDPYWNFFFIGAVEVPEVIIYIFLCRRIGNRRGLAIANVMSGVCLIVLVCIPADMVWLTILFSVFGKFFTSASFDTGFVYTPEIFPTVMRNVALGSSSTVARVGALLAPFVHQLADVTYFWVPKAIPGALSILSGFLVILLPETKGKPLSDTLTEEEEEEIEEISYPLK